MVLYEKYIRVYTERHSTDKQTTDSVDCNILAVASIL